MDRVINPPGFEGYVDIWNMSPGIWAGDFLYLTGMTGHFSEKAGSPPDAQIQAARAFDRATTVLQAAGCTWSDVVEMTSYHVDIQDTLTAFREIRATYVTPPFPAWTAIGVAALATPGVIHEIRIVAHKPTQ